MLLLFESSAGFALFKVLDEGKMREAETKVSHEGAQAARRCMHEGACGCQPPAAGPCKPT
jgi:hypothetical protein